MVETGSGSTYKQFVFRPSGDLLAVYSGSLVKGTIPLPGGGTAVYNSSGLSFIRHKDWLGSSRLATTWAHAVYSKESYAPFGETYNEAGTADRSFTGQDQNVQGGSGGTGVYDFMFRKYDPSAGRWLSPDPYGWGAVDLTNPQSLNRNIYLMNQTMSGVDPTGLCPKWLPWDSKYNAVGYDTVHNWYLSDDSYPCYYPPYGGGLGVSQGNPPPGSPFGNSNSMGYDGGGGGGGAPNDAQTNDCVTGQQILDEAARWNGTPYSHAKAQCGAAGDCSGTVSAIYGNVGINIALGSMTSGSSAQGIYNSPSLSQTSNPQPGNIVYWSTPYNHVMIFAGNGYVWGARRTGYPFGYYPMSWFGNGSQPTYLASPKQCK